MVVEPWGSVEIQPGEVVVFPHPQSGRLIVHRVVAVTDRGLVTKGDNSPAPDPWTLSTGDLVGRVVAVNRKGRLLPVPRREPVNQPLFNLGRWLDGLVSRLLRPIYHRLAATPVLKGRWPLGLGPRLLSFSHPEGQEWQLWWGGLLIAQKKPWQREWAIKRPFRLWVNPAALPGNREDLERVRAL